MNQRLTQLQHWLHQSIDLNGQLIALNNDASFRSYYRLQTEDRSYIIMDAPPSHENCAPYVAIAKQWQQTGIRVPDIIAQDIKQGFLLLSDFGDELLWHALNPESVNTLYQDAFLTLLHIQRCDRSQEYYGWPEFNPAEYQRELGLFTTWYLQEWRHITLSKTQQRILDNAFAHLIESALGQPQVCVHRDYHSRNLMLLTEQKLGVLDFQDALWGPITYDLVSLLRDCYIDWPQQQVIEWALQYQQLALENGIIATEDPQQFIRWLDWVGLQRHLKCMGIFSRLHLRDNKSVYLQYIPRVLDYIITVCHKYSEFKSLGQLLDQLK